MKQTGLLRGTPIAIPGGACDITHLCVDDIIHTMCKSTGRISEGRISDLFNCFIERVIEIECGHASLKMGCEQHINTDRGSVKAENITDNDIVLGINENREICELPVISVRAFNVLAPVINIKIFDEAGFYAKGFHILIN